MDEDGRSPYPISLRDVFFIIFSKKRVAVGIFLTVFLGTFLYCIVATPIYESSARVLVKPIVEGSLQFQSAPQTLRASDVTPEYINSEIGIMRSPQLLKRVVESTALGKRLAAAGADDSLMGKLKSLIKSLLGIASGPVDPMELAVQDLQKRISIESITMSNMIKVGMKGDNPREISDIVNKLLDLYIDQHIQVHRAEGSEEFFTNQVSFYADRLRELEKKLQGFQAKWSITDIAAELATNMEVLKTLRESLSAVRGQIAEGRTRIGETQQNLGAMSKSMRENPMLVELTRSLLPLMVEESRVLSLYPKTSVEYQDVHSQIEEIRNKIKNEQQQIIAGERIDLNALVSQEQALMNEVNRLQERSSLLSAKQLEYNRLALELDQYKKNYTLYQDKEEEARIENQRNKSRVANVVVTSRAEPSTKPVFPRRALMLAAALALGGLLGLAGAFTSYYMDHTVKMPYDLSRYSDIQVLGAVPYVKPPNA